MAADDGRVNASRLNAAGWVLSALDPGDIEPFAEHLDTCRCCQLIVADLEPAGRLLVTNSPVARAPASLMATTIARVRQAAGARD